MPRNNNHIEVDGEEFSVDRIGRTKTDRLFVISIRTEESTKGIPRSEFEINLNVFNRTDITDEIIEQKLNDWVESHPDFTINSFSVVEEIKARSGERVD